MGLIHEARKNGLIPDVAKPEKHKRRGGILIKSAEGVRFAYTANSLPKAALPEVVPVAEELIMEVAKEPMVPVDSPLRRQA